MSEVKNAVVVGKVDLKPRREVVVGRRDDKKPQFVPKERVEKPRGMKRADDGRESQAGNLAQLAELQYVKKQLRAAEEGRNEAILQSNLFSLDVKRFLGIFGQPGLGTTVDELKASSEYQALARALGL